MIQFTRQGGFTEQIGSLVVSGHYRQTEESKSPAANKHPLDGEINVFFGGMEFCLTDDDDNGLRILKAEDPRETVHPDYMIVSGNSGESVRFQLSDGTELNFATLSDGGVLELRISASFSDDAEGLELPYRPLRTSRIRDSGDGEFIIISDGANYRFNNSTLDPERQLVILDTENPVLSYGMIPVNKAFESADYIVEAAQNKQSYDEP
jgi:hypothetical protein